MVRASELGLVVEAFALGDLVEVPVVVDRAWSNDVLRVRTTSGTYAVKLFPRAMTGHRRAQLDVGLAVEQRVLDLGLVPMPQPISTAGRWLAEIDSPDGARLARCHRWVSGAPAERPLGPDLVRGAGHHLGVLHALGLDGGDTEQLGSLDLDRWTRAVRDAGDRQLGWAGGLSDLTPLIRLLAGDLELLRRERRPMRLSHRDFDPKNAVVDDAGQLVVTDWDHAGPVLAGVELVVAATSFADTEDGYAAFSTAYREAGGDAAWPDALAMTAESADVDWLLRNVEACAAAESPRDLPQYATAQDLIASLPEQVAAARRWRSPGLG